MILKKTAPWWRDEKFRRHHLIAKKIGRDGVTEKNQSLISWFWRLIGRDDVIDKKLRDSVIAVNEVMDCGVKA